MLAIYKPFGMTAYGRRPVAERRHTTAIVAATETVFSPKSTGTVAWQYAAAALVIIALLFLLLHRAGVGMHH